MTTVEAGAVAATASAPAHASAWLASERAFPFGAPRSTPALERRLGWERRYRRLLVTTDTLIVAVAAIGASLLHLALAAPGALAADPWVLARIPAATAVTWLVMLAFFRTRLPNLSGDAEYRRVAHATGFAFGVLAIVFLAFQWQGLRNQLILALPLGLVAMLVSRRLWRAWLARRRREGLFVSRAIVVGHRADVEHLIAALGRDGRRGFHVVGAALHDDADAAEVRVQAKSYPTVGSPGDVADAARRLSADTVIVASPVHDSDQVRRLSWQLEGAAAELVLFTGLTAVSRPRISMSQIEGLPLMQVRIPTFEGSRQSYKRALDVVVAACALVPLALVTPILALLIVLDSPGGVFYRQRRIGLNGKEFEMLKFRSMHAAADSEVLLLSGSNDAAGPMFKMRDDPRVTRVGRVLRRYSLDELPQFWNVLRGDMSVVGPRPPLPREVEGYDARTHRRLYIRPGITGPWQVGGRSDLSWEESIGLDLHYVENWSLTSDLAIMARTAKTMVAPRGAY